MSQDEPQEDEPQENPPAEENPATKDRLTQKQILLDADSFRETKGRWPTRDDGAVAGRSGETWSGYDQALHKGHRGLEPGQTLRGLLAARRRYHDTRRRKLTLALVRGKGSEHKAKTGRWPDRSSGQVQGEPEGETWLRWEGAVQQGLRGLPKRSSLAAVFTRGDAEDGNRKISRERPWRTLEKIQVLLANFNKQTGGWPNETTQDDALLEQTGETWRRLNKWLHEQHGTTVARLARGLWQKKDKNT